MITNSPRRPLFRIVYYQALIALLAYAVVWVVVGPNTASAVLMAGVIVVITNWVFVSILFRRRKHEKTTRSVTGFYLGEILKLALTAILLTIAVSKFAIAPLPLLITYFVLQILIWPMGMREVSKGFL